MRFKTGAIVSVVAAVALAGLVGGYLLWGGDTPTDELPIEVKMLSGPADIVLPLDAYGLSRTEYRIHTRAVQALGRDCMRRFGFDWPVTPNTPPAAEETANARRYGLLDVDHARAFAYARDPADEQYVRYIKDWEAAHYSDQATAVWFGNVASSGGSDVPTGGCYGEAERAFGKDFSTDDDQFVQQLRNTSYAMASADARVAAVTTDWSACMRQRGYDVRSPGDAAGKARDADAAQARQIAVADAECNREAKLAATFFAVETVVQRRLIDENGERLTEIKDRLTVSTQHAAEVYATTAR